ncbi:MAG: BTAD domain-containing putative transcriptional regulator [Oscillospiraceae bacterium]
MEKKDTFLESKLETPTTSGSFIVRERLIGQLNDTERRLVIISAGMGYGKTVLLTHYAKRYPEKCAWYHLNDTDNDIMVFARYLCKSVKKVAAEFETDFSPYLTLNQNEAMVRNLALDFSAAFRELEGQEICLILDDFQEITNDWIFRFLTILWDNDPGGLRLFLCTKSAVPAFCARYLLQESAMVLGADSLAFNLDELKQIIREYAAPGQLDAVAQAIQNSMEGWPAGVSFALLYFRQRQLQIGERDIESACQQSYLRDYLMHELFRKLPFELQHFLTHTSVLDYLRPDVCNALAEVDNGAGLLAYLEQENLFILRLSGGGRIYRCHSLFRAFLISQLQPALRLQLLKKAAAFYLHSPDKAQAVEYAIACGDSVCLQSAVEAEGPKALARGQLDTLRRWLEELKRLQQLPTPEILLLQAQYSERIDAWQVALDLADQVTDAAVMGERCWIEAKLLWARITRDQVSVQKSLSILEELRPYLREESGLQELRRQAAQLFVRNLLDMKRYEDALQLTLSRSRETAGQAQREIWRGELAVVCYFTMGDYRRAMQVYVTLCSNGGGGAVAGHIGLYLAVSGRVPAALSQMRHTPEEYPENLPRYRLEELLLEQLLVERIAELEGSVSPDTPEKSSLSGEAPSLHRLGALLHRAFLPEPLCTEDEDALFSLTECRLATLQDGARWLTLRRLARGGRPERVLELRRRLGSAPCCANAFAAFCALEEALLTPERSEAEQLVESCAPYLGENHLRCPGLSAQEQGQLADLLGERQQSAPISMTPSEEAGTTSLGRIQIHCFGKFRVVFPDGQELHWRTRKAEELFAYLFHLNGGTADRERMMDMLWPQAAPGSATSLLHTSIYSIRKSLALYGLDCLLQREKKGYRMDMALVDAGQGLVDAACRSKELDNADFLSAYEGPYLEDIEATWAEDSRAFYAGGFLHACRSLAEGRMSRGDFAGAADCLRAAVRQEPYDEALAGLLIRCYAALGETKNAMAQYKRLKEVLQEDLDTEPGSEVTRIYKECLLRRLESGRVSP